MRKFLRKIIYLIKNKFSKYFLKIAMNLSNVHANGYTLLLALVILGLVECQPENDEVINHYDWRGVGAENKSNPVVVKTWLRFDERTVRQNSRAEQEFHETDDESDAELPVSEEINLSLWECGTTVTDMIVGGEVANNEADPWIVILVYFDQVFCAGTIINHRWILTAAHCFEEIMNKNLARNLKLRVGTNLRYDGTLVNVSKVIMHPRYSTTDRFNSDIALIKISKALKFKHNVRPICLPSLTYSEPKAKSLLVAGWSALMFTDKTYPVQLRQVSLPIISLETCFDKFGPKSGINVFMSQICTWANGKDACRGDSGGPAIEHIDGQAYLVGIVSFGITCADQYPGMFTKVSYFLQWIRDTIDENS